VPFCRVRQASIGARAARWRTISMKARLVPEQPLRKWPV
jgi:hypothetical protein